VSRSIVLLMQHIFNAIKSSEGTNGGTQELVRGSY
jgi:hypothetical protein